MQSEHILRSELFRDFTKRRMVVPYRRFGAAYGYHLQGSTSVRNYQWRTLEFCWVGGSTNSVEGRGQRDRGFGGGSPLVRGSGGSCNLVQEISFHIVKFS